MLANVLDKLQDFLKCDLLCQNTFKEVVDKMRKKVPLKMKLKAEKKGFCESCGEEYTDLKKHQKSPQHLAILKAHNNFLSLDSLIASGADVSTFLDNTMPLNGERRSLRKVCNGELESRKRKCSLTPDNVNEGQIPKCNGALVNRRPGRKKTRKLQENGQFYKVIGVSTKLRSSSGFTRKKNSPPTCNGTKPLVVKFRKIRKSELSVLSDEAEQFMFPKRASSTSSTSSDEPVCKPKNPPASTPKIQSASIERRRLARPVALKEESSEEEWPGDRRKRRRKVPPGLKRPRLATEKKSDVDEIPNECTTEDHSPKTANPLRDEPVERCLKWQDGRLQYTPAVEQLEFAFEAVPRSEPWFETFKRQDQNKVLNKNVPKYFELYLKSPKLPYEISQLPPLKPNCCGLSQLPKREDKPGPSRSYGTRGMKHIRRSRKRIDALLALESHPRKSPREHASTLAMLGSAVLNRRKNTEDTKSTASEDTSSDTHSNTKVDPPISETQQMSERLEQFYTQLLEDDTDLDIPEFESTSDEATVTTVSNVPDVINLVFECENCDLIQREVKESVVDQIKTKGRGRFKKKNKTGWPKKKKFIKKESRENSCEPEKSLDSSSVEAGDEASLDTIRDDCSNIAENLTCDDTQTKENIEVSSVADTRNGDIAEDMHLDVKLVLQDNTKKSVRTSVDSEKRKSRSSASENEEKEEKTKKRRLQNVNDWLQPVVRVARVDTRMLRSSSKGRSSRLR